MLRDSTQGNHTCTTHPSSCFAGAQVLCPVPLCPRTWQVAMAFAPGAIKLASVHTLYAFASNGLAPSGGFDPAGAGPASLPYFLPRCRFTL